GARHVARHELDAGVVAGWRCGGPGRRPAALRLLLRGHGRQQTGEQALAAADVEHAAVLRTDQAMVEQAAKDRVPAELAARKVVGKGTGLAVRRGGRVMQLAPGGVEG